MADTELTPEDRQAAERFIRCVQLFRDFDPYMRLGMIRALLAVASNEYLPIGWVGERAGIPPQSVGRYLRKLGEGMDSTGKPALGLLEACRSPFDRRQRVVRLSPRGVALAEKIRDTMMG